MNKITFMGAGSTVFVRNVLGDCMCTQSLRDWEFALYDIDPVRLQESFEIISAMNRTKGGHGKVTAYLGVENRKEALRQEVCPDALFLNYTNPMAMLSGYMQRYTGIETVGLCHSVQVCSEFLLKELGMEDKLEGRRERIAGINHMSWLLELRDKDGNDLYPEIRRRAKLAVDAHLYGETQDAPDWVEKTRYDLVRLDYIRRFGYYCTESSEHNSEYNMFYIKSKYPELIDRYHIPLDEYPRRCVEQIAGWEKERDELRAQKKLEHERSREYASYIIESIVTGTPYKIGGNVLNIGGLIENLPSDACVEVPCLIDGMGVHPCRAGRLPVQCAAMNMTNINVQLLTIEAAVTRKKEHIYQAAMLDPHTGSELDPDTIVKLVDDLSNR